MKHQNLETRSWLAIVGKHSGNRPKSGYWPVSCLLVENGQYLAHLSSTGDAQEKPAQDVLEIISDDVFLTLLSTPKI